MQKRKLLSVALAAALLVSSVQASYAVPRYCAPVGGGGGTSAAPWFIIGCAGGIVLAALAANYRDGRELTAPEAWSCGILFLASQPNGKKRWRNG